MANKPKNKYLYGSEGHGQASEKKVAKRYGADVVRGSGAGHNKSDSVLKGVKNWPIRIESKATVHESMSIKRSWLVKIQREALETGMYPALTFTFTDEHGEAKSAGDWIAVPAVVMQEMLDQLRRQGDE